MRASRKRESLLARVPLRGPSLDFSLRAAGPPSRMSCAMAGHAGLTEEQIEIFATGLYHVANQDGIDPKEEATLRDFLKDTESALRFEELGEKGFSPLEAAQVLSTTYLRRIFVKSAIAMSRVDGVYSQRERIALGEIADAFGLTHVEFGELEHQALSEASLLA